MRPALGGIQRLSLIGAGIQRRLVPLFVMAGLGPAIHVSSGACKEAWMAGTRLACPGHDDKLRRRALILAPMKLSLWLALGFQGQCRECGEPVRANVVVLNMVQAGLQMAVRGIDHYAPPRI
jgi:hypothetical protein